MKIKGIGHVRSLLSKRAGSPLKIELVGNGSEPTYSIVERPTKIIYGDISSPEGMALTLYFSTSSIEFRDSTFEFESIDNSEILIKHRKYEEYTYLITFVS
jgi:hypothetical protein